MVSKLEKLISKYGMPFVNEAFTEYFMLLIGSRIALDEVRNCINKGGTLNEVLEIVQGGAFDVADESFYFGDEIGKE